MNLGIQYQISNQTQLDVSNIYIYCIKKLKKKKKDIRIRL